jgi:hypothetical protein
MADVTIVAEPFELLVVQRGNYTHYPSLPYNPLLNTVYDCSDSDSAGVPDKGKIVTTVSIIGTWLNFDFVALPIEITLSILNDEEFAGAIFSTGSLTTLTVTVSMGSAIIVTEAVRKNWVKWSNIGHLDFTIWKDNIAGERPLDWKGWVYAIKKLSSNKIVIYGENGASFLIPSDNIFGLHTIHRIGLKGRHAVCGNDKEHFFIDRDGRLYRVGEALELLDYREYLGTLGSSVVMSLDELNRLVYICDGMKGYIYSIDNKSLGSGPINITSIGSQSGTLYIGASSTIATPIFEICTDIYDMGSRKNKTLSTVELGTDATGDLWVTLDYRMDKAAAFKTLDWHKVSPNGVTNIPCFGVEFRVKVKRTTYAYFELDYIRVNGIIHNYAFQYPFVGR